jgi:hypothetical protein
MARDYDAIETIFVIPAQAGTHLMTAQLEASSDGFPPARE